MNNKDKILRQDKYNIKTKAEIRDIKRRKEKFSTTGGSWGAAFKRKETNRNYQGSPKILMPKIKIIHKNKKFSDKLK